MTRRLISKDELTGVETHHEYDYLTDETRVIYTGDAEPYIEANKALANDTEYSKQGIKQEFWKYASIPPSLQVKWKFEKGIDVYNKDHGAAIGTLVNSPEYKHLKVTTKYHKFK